MTSVTIIICTANRAQSLRETLQSMARLIVPADMSAELLVVDNASTDSTPQVVRETRLANLPVRYVHEPRPGQCHARNRGIAESDSQIILFTDDDVRTPIHWIEGMCRPIAQGRFDAIAGGVIFPPELDSRVQVRRTWFAATEDIDPSSPQRMVGANMAFSRRVLDRVPRFDTELGPGALGFADETLFAKQLLAAGYRIGAALDVAIEHCFDPSRLTRASILKAAQRMGRSEAYLAYHWTHEPFPPSIFGIWRPWLGLWRRRLLRPWQWIASTSVSDWELMAVMRLALWQQYRIESRRPRNYDRFGLIKKTITDSHGPDRFNHHLHVQPG